MGCPRPGASIALTLVLLCGATGAGAQGVLEGTEVIDFDYLDLEFQVDALTFGFRDRTRLVTDGFTFSVSGGFSWEAFKNTRLAIEAFYSPLQVQRSADGSTDNDPLFNIRAMIGYRLR